MPRSANVVNDPRAPESKTLTFLYKPRTNSRALASLPPGCFKAYPHADK